MNYGLAITLTPRVKILLGIVILHAVLLFLNLYVFTKLAEDMDVSFYKKRKYWNKEGFKWGKLWKLQEDVLKSHIFSPFEPFQ